jgi:hypothetical protein
MAPGAGVLSLKLTMANTAKMLTKMSKKVVSHMGGVSTAAE